MMAASRAVENSDGLLLMAAARQDGDDGADQWPHGKREKSESKTIGLLSHKTYKIRTEKPAEIPNRVDQSDARSGAGTAQKLRRHRPEWPERSPDPHCSQT